MITVNAPVTTKGGIIIPSGMLLKVVPKFFTDIKNGDTTVATTQYGVDAYLDLVAYYAKNPMPPTLFDEFDIGYVFVGGPFQGSTRWDAIEGEFATHIENGDATHPGVGATNTALTYPA